MKTRKICIVTGGSGFLGESIARELVSEGRYVISLDKSIPNYELKNFLHFDCDIRDRIKVREILKSNIHETDYLELLINNAAIDAKVNELTKPIQEFANDNFMSLQLELEVAIQGSLIITQECLPYFRGQNKSIIFIGSDLSVVAPDQRIYRDNSGKQTYRKPISYSIVKHATLGIVKYLAVELAPLEIRVNSVSPGPIAHEQPLFVQQNIQERVPLGRLGTRRDVVGAIKFLAGESSNYITGQNIQVDGGRTIW